MAIVAVDFEHMGETFHAGDEMPDDHPLVTVGPHLFVQPDPDPDPEPAEPVRIRGPLVDPPSKSKPRGGRNKE